MKKSIKQWTIGGSWILIGIIILMSVLVFSDMDEKNFIQSNNTILQTTSTNFPIDFQNHMSSKVIMYTDLSVDQTNISFDISKEYQNSFDLYKSKVFMEEKDYAKSFKDFIESIGFSIDKEGRILDASKRTVDPSFINCHVVGFIPDKPYIKPNC